MRRPVLAISLASALALLPLAIGLARLRIASTRAEVAISTLVSVARDARELLDLRTRQATRAAGEQPTQDTLARVTAALAEAGIPAVRLKSLERESDSEIPDQDGIGDRLRALSMRLVLDPVTVVQLGTFLSRWRESQSLWTVSRLELTHAGPADERDGTFTARLVITAVYIARDSTTESRLAPSTVSQPGSVP